MVREWVPIQKRVCKLGSHISILFSYVFISSLVVFMSLFLYFLFLVIRVVCCLSLSMLLFRIVPSNTHISSLIYRKNVLEEL